MTIAERIVRILGHLLPPNLRPWGEAAAQEAASIDNPTLALAFAVSCGFWVVRASLGHVIRSLLTGSSGEPEGTAVDRPSWRARELALACAIMATGLGLIFLWVTGAPGPYLIQNLTALIAGLIIVAPFRRLDPVTAPFVGVVALAIGTILLLTAIFGDEASDGRRWLSLGPMVIQPSLIGLPFLLVAFARSRDSMTTAGLILAAIALAMQPDQGMAASMVAALGLIALMAPDRRALMSLAVAALCFVAAVMWPVPKHTTSVMDGLLGAGTSTNLIAVLAALFGIVVLLLPTVFGFRRGQKIPLPYSVFGTTWLALILAPLLAEDFIPVVAYGGSAIVGYVWSILALPAEASRSECSALMGRSAAGPIEDVTDSSGNPGRASPPVPRCLIPRFDGVIHSLEWKEAIWARFVTGAPRPRTPSEQQYSDRKLLSRR